EDLRRQLRDPRALLAHRRRRGPDPRPPGDPDRRRAARQAQAGVHPARGHGRLRRRDQRGEDLRHGLQAHREALLPPLGLPRRPQVAHAERDARPAPRGGHPHRGQGDAPEEPPGPAADHEAQGLRGPRASPRRPAARPDEGGVL
ncbi:MAG: LSU ribosomal protein L13p (L13Ae), partial [uncultured Solirubrobacteraceae bacterium]